jgi:hypothetical protein
MKMLNLFRSEPTPDVQKLSEILSEDNESTRFNLYEGAVDYDRLVELIFSNDKVISWW